MPDDGRFRVTVTAAKYNDGLLLDPGAPPQTVRAASFGAITKTPGTVTIPKAGIYQVDIYGPEASVPPPDVVAARRRAGRHRGRWMTAAAGRLEGNAKLVDSPFGKAVSLNGSGDAFTVPRDALPPTMR